ncbi:MAG: type II secretion system protein GspD [Gammaproteobacteria bacterium]
MKSALDQWPRAAVVLAVLGLLAGPVAADDFVFEIIPLRHALLDDVLPTLRELVAPGGTVTGMQDKLIVRTTPDNLAQLKDVLGALDRRLRQLRISVSQDAGREYQWQEDGLRARIAAGEAAVALGGPGGARGPGASVSIGDGDSRVTYRNLTTRGAEDRNASQFVTTVEGSPAWINAGQVLPLANRQFTPTPYGAAVVDSIEYRNVGTGFYVTPRVAGDNVTLEISPYSEQLSRQGGGAIDSRGLNTVVSGKLGQWIALGGSGQHGADQGSGIVHRTRATASESYDVWVKVDVVE